MVNAKGHTCCRLLNNEDLVLGRQDHIKLFLPRTVKVYLFPDQHYVLIFYCNLPMLQDVLIEVEPT